MRNAESLPSGCLAQGSSGLIKPQKVPSSTAVGHAEVDGSADVGVDGIVEVESVVELFLFSKPRLGT